MKSEVIRKPAQSLKVKTNLKAGECCWNAYTTWMRSGKSADWNNFVNCCNSDPNCTYFTGG